MSSPLLGDCLVLCVLRENRVAQYVEGSVCHLRVVSVGRMARGFEVRKWVYFWDSSEMAFGFWV